jgi:hypothetical protein
VWTWRTGSAAGALVRALPWLVGVGFADPAGVIAWKALDRLMRHGPKIGGGQANSEQRPPKKRPQRWGLGEAGGCAEAV